MGGHAIPARLRATHFAFLHDEAGSLIVEVYHPYLQRPDKIAFSSLEITWGTWLAATCAA